MEALRAIGLKPEWDEYYKGQAHICAENMDKVNMLHLLLDNDEIDKEVKAFIHWHIEGTTPVFGEWNYTKSKKEKT